MQIKNKIIIIASIALLIALMAVPNISANKNSAYLSLKTPLFQSPSNNTTYIAVNLTSEIDNSGLAGYNFTQSNFAANSSSQCLKVLISNCNNNNPSQSVCINGAYKSSYEQQHANLSFNESGFCPEYMLAGQISCAIQNNYCVVTRNGNPMSENNTQGNSTNSTTISNSGSPSTSSVTTTVLPKINSTSIGNGVSSISNIINGIIQFLQSLLQKL